MDGGESSHDRAASRLGAARREVGGFGGLRPTSGPHRDDFKFYFNEENFQNILALESKDKFDTKVSKMTDYSKNFNTNEVPDPYYGGPQGFEYVLDLLEDSCAGLLDHILKEHTEIKCR